MLLPTPSLNGFTLNQRHALDARRNLVVRASAGSGKTRVLVERIFQILAGSRAQGGTLGIRNIVAITFTRKAAAEIQDRLREIFLLQEEGAQSQEEQRFWAAQAETLPLAMIGTIDSLCARILREHGWLVESSARLDPDFGAVDSHEEVALRREAISQVVNRLSSPVRGKASPEIRKQRESCQWWAEHEGYQRLESHLQSLLSHGVDPELVLAAHARMPPPEQRVKKLHDSLPAVRMLHARKEELMAGLRQLIKLCKQNQRSKTAKKLHDGLIELLAEEFDFDQPKQIQGFLTEFKTLLYTKDGQPQKLVQKLGPEFEEIQDTWLEALQALGFDTEGEVHAQVAANHLARVLKPVRAAYLRLCRETRHFDFLTLARLTRELLTNHEDVCARLRSRWRYVLVDEFQDTNQLQWEIIACLVGDGPEGPLDRDRLFIVGDPQQSIYRFRHADVGVFTRVSDLITKTNRGNDMQKVPTIQDDCQGAGSSTVEQRLGSMPLAESFRALHPVPLLLMDRVFQSAFAQTTGLDPAVYNFEVAYQPLLAGRVIPPGVNGEVYYLIPGDDDAADPHAAEPEARDDEGPGDEPLGSRQVSALVEQLKALHGQPRLAPGPDDLPTLRWNDMAVLLPSRTLVLTDLESQFRRAGIPFVVTRGVGFWQRQEVRDVVQLATWLADQGNDLPLFAILRGPIGHLTDTECLFLSLLGRGSMWRGLCWIRQRGPDLEGPLSPDSASHHKGVHHWQRLLPGLRQALEKTWEAMEPAARTRLYDIAIRLRRWIQRVDRMAHADLLQRCLTECGAYGMYAAEVDADVSAANLARLFDTIRSIESDSAPVFASLARNLRDLVQNAVREEQAALAQGQDAVQVMTVHAAKGLEFPVVAVMKMERAVDRTGGSGLMVVTPFDRLLPGDRASLGDPRPGTLAVRVRHPERPREVYKPQLLRALQDLDRAQEAAESRRLFYVAATRAQERLILVGKEPRPKKDGSPGTLKESWQLWFEQSLGITAEDKARGFWEDPSRGQRITIITRAAETPPWKVASSPTVITRPVALQYLHETPLHPTVAVTRLAEMLADWSRDPREWWLKYGVQVIPFVSPPLSAVGDAGEGFGQLGELIGTLVHRVVEWGESALNLPAGELHARVKPLAAAAVQEDRSAGPADSESGSLPETTIDGVSRAVCAIIGRLNNDARGQELRDLLFAPGEVEVPFALRLGNWHVSGRYDKLLPVQGGHEVIDWKTDAEPSIDAIVQRYELQMKLYALALLRAGLHPPNGGPIRVQLALLHHLATRARTYDPAVLESFAEELESTLGEMAAFARTMDRDRSN